MTVEDAPWIREAEIFGMDDGPEVRCPVCGALCNEVALDQNDDVVGCNLCIRMKDAVEWMESQDDGRPED